MNVEQGIAGRVHIISALFLCVLGFFSAANLYFGAPIECWMPAQFTESMERYGNSYCYFSDKYYLPFSRRIPERDAPSVETNFYKRTPFLLLILAVFYMLPWVSTSLVSQLFVSNLDNITWLSRQSKTGSTEIRKTAIDQLVVEVETRLSEDVDRSRRVNHWGYLDRMRPSLSVYIRFQKLFSKLAYVASSFFITAILYSYLKLDSKFDYQNVAAKVEKFFPHTVLCDFMVRMMANVHRYTVQCHLPSNDMFQKMVLLVCFLSVVILSVSCSEFVVFSLKGLFQWRPYPYVKRHMKLFAEVHSGYDNDMVKSFCELYLKTDGMYLIQLIGQNSSDLVVSRVLEILWDKYQRKLFGSKAGLHGSGPTNHCTGLSK